MSNPDSRALDAALRHSRVYALADRCRALLVSAVLHSRVSAGWRRIARQVVSSTWVERRMAAGTIALTASAWHILLVLMFGEYASPLAFALPGLVGALGALAMCSTTQLFRR